jgi:hypothetical protein
MTEGMTAMMAITEHQGTGDNCLSFGDYTRGQMLFTVVVGKQLRFLSTLREGA